MSCTDFPSTGLIPNVTTHSVGSITYVWTGEVWESQINVPVFAGPTANRPSNGQWAGLQYYDTDIEKPIWWSGAEWKDAAGAVS